MGTTTFRGLIPPGRPPGREKFLVYFYVFYRKSAKIHYMLGQNRRATRAENGGAGQGPGPCGLLLSKVKFPGSGRTMWTTTTFGWTTGAWARAPPPVIPKFGRPGGVGWRRPSSAREASDGPATPTSRRAAAAFDQRPSRAHSSARSARAAAAASAERRAVVEREARVASRNRASRSPRSQRSRRASVNLATCPRCRRPPRPDGGRQSKHLDIICNSTTAAREWSDSTRASATRNARAHRTRAFCGTCLSVGIAAAWTSASGGSSPKESSAWTTLPAAAARRAGQQRRQHCRDTLHRSPHSGQSMRPWSRSHA